jgi:DNA adenine methylase
MKHISPLRYPGGKAGLSDFLTDVIERNDLKGRRYYEPYAGGAGAALSLLEKGTVSEIYINDADKRIYAFWRACLYESDRFIEKILHVPLTMDEWRRQNEICSSPRTSKIFDLGFAAFYMNRCNRSGVLSGAGPIGGYQQSGTWRLDVRFNREGLATRITSLARQKHNIHISKLDAIDFLKSKLPRGSGRSKVFVYLDPPYVNKGRKLYFNAYQTKDHKQLTEYLTGQATLSWLVSYDDDQLVRSLYAEQKLSLLPIRYTLQEKRTANELIIAPHRLRLPNSARIRGQESMLQLL